MANSKRRFLSLLTLGILLISLTSGVFAESNQRRQIRVRAAFIYQMAKFVNWSIDKKSPLVFCLFNDKRAYNVSSVLTNLKSQGKLKVQDHPVRLKFLDENKVSELEHYYDCSLIYFNPNRDRHVPNSLVKELSKSKLAIGSDKTFVADGGLSALVLERGKHKLYINRVSYEGSLVKIRSRLLSLARFYPN